MGISVKCAVADDAAVAVIHVKHGRKTEIDAMRTQLRCQYPARLFGQLFGLLGMLVPNPAEFAHGWNAGKALAETLHATAFMVYRNQQWRLANLVDAFGQRLELGWIDVVAGKQDD